MAVVAKVVLVGGQPTLMDAETKVVSGTLIDCPNIPTLPHPCRDHVTAYFQEKLIVRAGYLNRNCIVFNESLKKWESASFMLDEGRSRIISVVASSDEWWIAGGGLLEHY